MGTVPLFRLSHRETKYCNDLSLMAPLPTVHVILPSGRISPAMRHACQDGATVSL